MKATLTRVVILPFIVGAVAFSACSSDDELTLAQYFERVQEISTERSAEIDGLDEKFDALGEDDVDGLHDVFHELSDINREGIEEIDDVGAPGEVGDEHKEFVKTGLAMSDKFDEIVDEIGDADTMEEAFDIFLSTDALDGAEAEFVEACEALQKIGTDAGIEVDLDCGGSDND